MEAQKEMPRYKCHKTVGALKIRDIIGDWEQEKPDDEIGSITIVPEEHGFASIEVDRAYLVRHKPQPGGYYVVYDDGYQSFSPAKAFEAGYTRIERYGSQDEDPAPETGKDGQRR